MLATTVRFTCSLAIGIAIAACGSAPPAEDVPANVEPVGSSDAQTLPPPGYGTLRQDDFTISLQAGRVQMKATPMAESVIRLAAPDTYQRLHRLVESRSEQIRELARRNGLRQDPLVMQISFYTYEVQAAFQPTDVVILSQGRQYRPIGILPITPEWGREQLIQQRLQRALYLFDPAIDLSVVFQTQYGGVTSFDWAAIIPRLEGERGRVMSRAGG